jgi:glucose-6-phosphate 1-epimerase
MDLPPGVRLEPGRGGLTKVVVATDLATAEVYLHGAHVTHYQPAGQAPVLFLSRQSLFAAGKAIRGGVPICFPWFGPLENRPKAPGHGFARTSAWTLAAATRDGGGVVTLTFELSRG